LDDRFTVHEFVNMSPCLRMS